MALDLGGAIEVAFARTRHLPNAHVVQADLVHPPVRRCFDVALSVGVLHHLPDPRAGFEALQILGWVSGTFQWKDLVSNTGGVAAALAPFALARRRAK